MTEFMKCNTCLASFPSMEVIKDHYRGDWHCFNSKRRAQNLPVLRREQFLELVKAHSVPSSSSSTISMGINRNSANGSVRTTLTAASLSLTGPKRMSTTIQHDHSKQQQRVLSPNVSSPSKLNCSTPSSLEKKFDLSETNETAERSSKAENADDVELDEDLAVSESGIEEQEEAAEAVTEAINKRNIDYEPVLGSAISVFDDKSFPTSEEALSYMSLKYGFFLPDMEYMVDLEGMIEYLNEKVKLGNICLFCQKRFNDGRSTQHHMISKSHCKLTYEEGVDTEEYEEFYDFSSTYEDLEEEELDENGEIIQNEASTHPTTGELILPDGKILGHRSFRRYYKQYYSLPDQREPVLAQQREELFRLGYVLNGGNGGIKKGLDIATVSAMNETQLMTTLIQYQKAIRKNQIIEQKAQIRKLYKDRRREYKSTVDKLRSSENTTAKIRDYHGLL
jgi:pre-60S factor REI1